MSRSLRLLSFSPAHASGLILRPGAALVLGGLPPLPQLARAYAAAGPAWTLAHGDTPLACGGVVRFWPGVGELWCWAGQEAGRWSVGFARLARRTVTRLLEHEGFHRLQAHVRKDDGQARGFAQFLGLRREGDCPGYGPDTATYQLYGRFSQWKA